MFRFSIRDLLWLTLVVAVGLGWFVSQRQYRAELNRAKLDCDAACASHEEKAERMQSRVGFLEMVLRDDGWEVKWADNDVMTAHWPRKGEGHSHEYLQRSIGTGGGSPPN